MQVIAIRKEFGVNRPMRNATLVLIALLISPAIPAAPLSQEELMAAVSSNDVVWDEPGRSSADSMPLGNGDIGLNVWTEPNGDILFYIGKSDAWTENPMGTAGLGKVGRVRLSFTPALFGGGDAVTNGFSQTLRLYDGQIVIRGLHGELRLWVDANAPVIHAESKGSAACVLTVSLDPYRMEEPPAQGQPSPGDSNSNLSALREPKPDHHAEGLHDRLAWCHFDGTTNALGKPTIPEVVNWGFGALVQGRDMTANGKGTLVSSSGTDHEVAVTVASGKAASASDWIDSVLHASTAAFPASEGKQWQAHAEWWHSFWDRSYIFAGGTPEAEKVTQGYTLQRFVTACAGRGAWPIKFNGSLFVVDWPSLSFGKDKATGQEIIRPVTADFRLWGGRYWFQNTRAMYWPRLKAGDNDILQPLFRMYLGQIRNNEATVKKLYNHEGSYVAETSPHWGALPNLVGKTNGAYTDFYFTPVLELSTMMLDYYDHTQDEAFVRETLFPFANLGLAFFANHFPRDDRGKLLLSPDNAIEMYWMVSNPLPDIAGLHYVLARLQQLPSDLATPEMKKSWSDLQAILPPVPVGPKEGKTMLLPYDPALNGDVKAHNFENPELYAVYPFRLHGLPELGKADIEAARNAYDRRLHKAFHCWGQDPIDAAYLGLTDEAKRLVLHNLTNKDPRQKFPAFWDKGHDYAPDQDIGGNGELALQLMMMQTEGRKILLLPAWPKEWSCTFKLHAPFKTVISGTVADGKVASLAVDPPERRKDVQIAGGQPLP